MMLAADVLNEEQNWLNQFYVLSEQQPSWLIHFMECCTKWLSNSSFNRIIDAVNVEKAGKFGVLAILRETEGRDELLPARGCLKARFSEWVGAMEAEKLLAGL